MSPLADFSAVTFADDFDMFPKKPKIYLIWSERAIKVRESCNTRWNNAWISLGHGSLDFKGPGVDHLDRYLIGEIRDSGVDVTREPNWHPSGDGATRHHGGSGYEGSLAFPSAKEALRFLEEHFTLVKCGKWPKSL
jgi:hypothetical protein